MSNIGVYDYSVDWFKQENVRLVRELSQAKAERQAQWHEVKLRGYEIAKLSRRIHRQRVENGKLREALRTVTRGNQVLAGLVTPKGTS